LPVVPAKSSVSPEAISISSGSFQRLEQPQVLGFDLAVPAEQRLCLAEFHTLEDTAHGQVEVLPLGAVPKIDDFVEHTVGDLHFRRRLLKFFNLGDRDVGVRFAD
jgi:hypothetical protein